MPARAPAALRRLAHFLRRLHAQRALRQSPLFDRGFYLARNPDVAASGEDPLAHYVRKGARQGRDPNPWFDSDWYLDTNPGLREAGRNPLLHYLREGAAAGVNPSPGFDTVWYRARHPEVAASGLNPLEHFLLLGERQGLSPVPRDEGHRQADPPPRLRPPPAPDLSAFASLAPRAGADAPRLDVIMPVYGAKDDTLNALRSVLAAPVRTPFELVVIDDCGPEDGTSEALGALASRGLITLLCNPRNLGFVATVNRGMSLHPDRDVLLLNTDTQVHGDWLDRLCAHLERDPQIASVTPFSNNAEICSYPRVVADTGHALELPDADLDALAARVNAGRSVDLPTAVGFAMLIRRAALQTVGHFDEAHFGKGYGEENDWCRRAVAAGWRHVLAGDVFVRHYGGSSFAAEKLPRIAAAMRMMETLHPGYRNLISDYVKADPARALRERLDVARLARDFGGGAVLMISHALGGGTARHVAELSERLAREGIGVLHLSGDLRHPGRMVLTGGADRVLPNLPRIELTEDPAPLARLLGEVGVAHIHVHHLLDAGPAAAAAIPRLAAALGCAFDVTVHDYFGLCPRVNLIDASGLYCGEPELHVCERCVAVAGTPVGPVAMAPWRAASAALWRGARAVFVPDADVAARLARYVPDAPLLVRPHEEAPPVAPPAPPRPAAPPGAPRRIAVIGAIGPPKGAAVLEEVSAAAARAGLPLHFVVIGVTDRDHRLADRPNLTILGRYREDEALARIAQADADCAWFPAVWPETYSYTLSHALAAGLHPVAFDLGAIAARLRRTGAGTLLPLALARDPATLARRLAEMALPPVPETARPVTRYESLLLDYYGFAGGRLPGRGRAGAHPAEEGAR